MRHRTLLLAGLLIIALGQVATSQTTPRRMPIEVLDPGPPPSCDWGRLDAAAKGLIGPHVIPEPLPTPDPETCTGRVCDALNKVIITRDAYERAVMEAEQWQLLDAAEKACGLQFP